MPHDDLQWTIMNWNKLWWGKPGRHKDKEWGFKNELQRILPPASDISDVQTSKDNITTKIIRIYIHKVAH